MRKKELIENILAEELKRFTQIGKYVNVLNEQVAGPIGSKSSGFVDSQGASPRLEKYNKFQSEMAEQEEPNTELEGQDLPPIEDMEVTDTEEVTGDAPVDDTEELEVTDDVTLDDAPVDDAPVDDTEELEVTDIVNMTKETGEKTDELGTSIDKQSQNLNSLIDKLDDLESKLDNMDNIMAAVNNLDNKFEKYRPQTPVEKLELRSLDSGPFNQSPKDYWEEKEGKIEKQKDKHEYRLNGEEVSNYNQSDIKNSWVYSPEDE